MRQAALLALIELGGYFNFPLLLCERGAAVADCRCLARGALKSRIVKKSNVYPGLHDDRYGGMTDVGKIIRDAWVFGLLPEGETCVGWDYARLERLYERVHAVWETYGYQISRLPEELRARHERVHGEALRRARELGWSGELELEDE